MASTSTEPPAPEPTAFEETYSEFRLETDFSIWKPTSPKESTSEGRTRVPSSDIIVEMPSELEIKVEQTEVKLEDPLEIKLEEPASPGCDLLTTDYPVMYIVAPPFSQTPAELSYMTAQPLPDPITQAHLLDPGNVQSILMDPGEGPSGLSSGMLGLLEESEPFAAEEGRQQQRLPAFTQAFQTAQSPKPPPPPPPH